jgi:hypothetical protein
MHVPQIEDAETPAAEEGSDALDSISLMLGGTPHNEQGNITGRPINRERA